MAGNGDGRKGYEVIMLRRGLEVCRRESMGMLNERCWRELAYGEEGEVMHPCSRRKSKKQMCENDVVIRYQWADQLYIGLEGPVFVKGGGGHG